MYNNYFNFSCSPFENTLEQRFLFLSEGHEEVISALLYFIKSRKSFALVCGDVGTGKTMIIHHLLGRLTPSVKPIMISFPEVEYAEILRCIARNLNIGHDGKGVLELTEDVKAALERARQDGEQVVLIIDEAHLLPVSGLEHIRLLSNMETDSSKLLQILLIGQNELSYKLRKKEMRQLRQRVNINRILSPMSEAETVQYVDHRLKVADSSFDRCFDPACGKLIHKMTKGVPRSINQLCDTALLICMSESADKVTGRTLKKARIALNSDLIHPPEVGPLSASFLNSKLKWALGCGLLILLFGLGSWGYRGFLSEKHSPKTSLSDAPAINTSGETSRPAAPKALAESESPPPAAEVPNPGIISASIKPEALAPAQQGAEVEAGTTEPAGRTTGNDKSAQPATSPPAEKAEISSSPAPGPRAYDPIQNSAADPAQLEVNDPDRNPGENPAAIRIDLQTAELTDASPEGYRMTVKRGDTLSGIAVRFFPDDPISGRETILLANPQISDQDLIFEGRTLIIPRSREPGPEKR